MGVTLILVMHSTIPHAYEKIVSIEQHYVKASSIVYKENTVKT